MKTKEQILEQIVKKQDEYLDYLLKSLKMCNVLWDISIGVREDYDMELSDLKKQLEEEKKCRDCSHFKKVKNRPCIDCEDYDLWEPIK